MFTSLILLLIVSPLPAFQSTDHNTTTPAGDWTRIAPGDAHFYAELNDLAGIRAIFRTLGFWEVVRELSEAPTSTSQPWHLRAEQFLGMDSDQAIDEVLGKRAALIATESSQWQNGVMLAELRSAGDLKPLLKKWQAKKLPEEGIVQRYTLSGGLMLAVLENTLALGPPDDPEGLWGRTVLLMSGRKGPNLAGRADFAALRSRLSTSHQGLLFVSWPEDDPTAVAGCSRLLAGFSVSGSEIHCELQGRLTSPAVEERPCDLDVLRILPTSTLVALSGTQEFQSLGKRAKVDLPSNSASLLTFLANSLTTSDDENGKFLDKLGPAYTIIVGSDSRQNDDYETPTLALLVPTRDGDAQLTLLDQVLTFVAQITGTLVNLKPEQVAVISVEHRDVEEIDVHAIEMGSLLAKRLNLPFLARMNLCWCILDGRLVVSTSLFQIKEIIHSCIESKKPAKAKEQSPFSQLNNSPAAGQIIFVRGVAVSRMLRSWLTYLEQHQPEMLTGSWWRSWAAGRMERFTKLGVALEPDKTSPIRTIVREVDAQSPAEEYLQPGDIIIGTGGRALSTTRPAQEVAQRYRERGSAKRFAVSLIREGKPMEVSIPVQPAELVDMAGFDPVRVLRQAMTLTRHVDTVLVRRNVTKPDRLDARIDIRWEKDR